MLEARRKTSEAVPPELFYDDWPVESRRARGHRNSRLSKLARKLVYALVAYSNVDERQAWTDAWRILSCCNARKSEDGYLCDWDGWSDQVVVVLSPDDVAIKMRHYALKYLLTFVYVDGATDIYDRTGILILWHV